MKTVNPGFKLATKYGSVHTELKITWFDENGAGHIIRGAAVVSESLILTSAICDEEKLRFGGCIASELELDISSRYDLTNRYITVSCTKTATMPLYPGTEIFPGASVFPGGVSYTESFDLFSGDVFSCKLGKNRLTRHLIAYDRFYSKGMKSCLSLYQSLFGGGGSTTLGALRSAIISQFGFTEDEAVTLPADDFVIYKMDCDELYVNDAMRMIAEINGVFMLINGHGDIVYITIGTGRDAPVERYDYYIDAECDELPETGFDHIDTHSIGVYTFPNAETEQEYPYDLDDPLVLAGYGTPSTGGVPFQTAWSGIKAKIEPNFTVSRTPFRLKSEARLWVELGDVIEFDIVWYALVGDTAADEHVVSRTTTVRTVLLSRRLSGIQAMKDELE